MVVSHGGTKFKFVTGLLGCVFRKLEFAGKEFAGESTMVWASDDGRQIGVHDVVVGVQHLEDGHPSTRMTQWINCIVVYYRMSIRGISGGGQLQIIRRHLAAVPLTLPIFSRRFDIQ